MSRTFQSKKACKQCGGFERYLSDKRCAACARSKANKDFVAVKSVNTISENKKRRDDAKKTGNARYLSLTKCPELDCKSHQNFAVVKGTWRYVSNSDCCECNIRRVQAHKENRKANNDDNAFLLIDTMHKLRTHRYERVKHVINDKEALKKAIKKWEDDTITQVKSQNKDHLVPLIKEIAKDDKIDPLQQHTAWF